MSLALKQKPEYTGHTDSLDIPDFLRISQEDRKAAWKRYKPKRIDSHSHPDRRYLSETQAKYENRLLF
jgi:hypothetical protein